MAFKITWSEPAIGDLASLTEYIAQDNPDAAEKMGLRLLQRVRHLTEQPLMGRAAPEIRRKDVRELIESPYRIIYRIHAKTNTIEIIRVWHGARGIPQIDG